MDQTQPRRADSPSGDAPITRWITELEQGDHSAARQLWKFLHRRLLRAAKKEVTRCSRPAYDEEDVALSAFDTLCRGIQERRYELADRDELWRLAATIAVNKARQKFRNENRLCRGGGVERVGDDATFLEALVSPEPPPDLVWMMREECQRLLAMLERQDVRSVAMLKVDGYTNEEVAEHLGCTRRSVQRRLALIRDIWSGEVT